MKKTVKNLDSSVYYTGIYWNDLEIIKQYMSYNFTGHKDKWWIKGFKQKYAKKPFNHALFLNCGDGRFERQFIDDNIVSKVTAFDISPDLIKKAKKERGKRKINYKIADVNTINFKENQFDLIVNIAALHHVQYIDRICRILCKAIKDDGLIISFDYIGPRRNQYPLRQVLSAYAINAFLPSNLRQKLTYPHLPTMLVTDPTEAIHSNLIISSLKRYFTITEKNDTWGGIAYLLLTHNKNLKSLKTRYINKYVSKILFWDKLFGKLRLTPNLFSYFIAKPNKITLNNKIQIDKYKKEEKARETRSRKLRGVYSFIDYLKIIILANTGKDRLYLIKMYLKYLYQEYIKRK